MKYFIDMEFLEGTQKKRFMGFSVGETKPTIDLISIGIVAEDSREYYAVSNEFNIEEAWNRWEPRTGEGDRNNMEPKKYWIRENVLKPIYEELYFRLHSDNNVSMLKCGVYLEMPKHCFTLKNLKKLIVKYGKPNAQIAEEVKRFCSFGPIISMEIDRNFYCTDDMYHRALRDQALGKQVKMKKNYASGSKPKFYGYYADYDWVALCWLFGKMIDLPKDFPMYCYDLKQEMDRLIEQSWDDVDMSTFGHTGIENIKNMPGYPKQVNEHNALADARWIQGLFTFLQTIKSHQS